MSAPVVLLAWLLQDATPTAPTSAPASTSAPTSAPRVGVAAEPGQGVTIDAGERFSLNLRSRFQLRYQLTVPPEDASGDRRLDQIVNVGTARLWFSGRAFRPTLTYMIQLAIAGRDFREGPSPIFDAFLDWKAHRDVSVRAGQFFVPFDRLRTVREFALQMCDRPRPVGELTLDRDVGVVLYSDRFLSDGSPVAIRVGAFGGGGTNLTPSQGKEPGALAVARFELRPLGPVDDDSEGDLLRRPRPAVAIGAAVAGNWNTNRPRSTTGAVYTGGTTDYLHVAADVVAKWRGVALQAEYLWRRASDDQITSTNLDGTPLVEATRSGHGWIAQASYVFAVPLELVGRLSRLHAFAGTDPAFVAETGSRGQEVAGGLNYYVNNHQLKVQADWIARMPATFEMVSAEQLVHVQLDATF